MVSLGDSVTLRKKTSGDTMTGTVVGYKVKLDKPIMINTSWYQDTITNVDVPGSGSVYELISSGGARKLRKTRKQKKGRKYTRRN